MLTERLGDHRRARFRCDCGTVKELKLSNVTGGRTSDCADRGRHPDPRHIERPTYSAAHQRIVAARGRASELLCFRCGRRADQWAYLSADPDQLIEEHGREVGFTYSADPQHYAPACRPCHRTWDAARAAAAPRHALSLVHHAYAVAHGLVPHPGDEAEHH
ncbi:hypothetical protein AVL62_08770 [Serinicoccus chungangensis]|uniref:Uncharacterized protein n=1 Tax=Serinicoccus chungangensis TaxID=767452 RepID=A0A0W8I1F8_9MICO|nr:hypothetical protein AVL62_08770 [Serinicoccus chungangensis]